MYDSVAWTHSWCCATVASNSKIFSSPQKEHLYPLSTHSPFSPFPELLATSSLNSPYYYAFSSTQVCFWNNTLLFPHTQNSLDSSSWRGATASSSLIHSQPSALSLVHICGSSASFSIVCCFLPSIGFLEALLRTTMQMLRIILWGGRKDYAYHREQRLRKFKLSSLLVLCLCNCSSPVLKTLPPESFVLNVLAIPLLSVWLCSCVRKAKIQHTKGIHTFVFHKATWACSDTHLSLVLAGILSVPGAFC